MIHPPGHGQPEGLALAAALAAAVLLTAYPAAAVASARRFGPWPRLRTVCWSAGVLCAAAALAGPLARMAHADFASHMLAHLLLGMLGPLLMALAAPMTLLFRTLRPRAARRLSRLLRSAPLALLARPETAALLNIGGLWALYATGLFAAMHHHAALYLLVHWHMLAAGYLFSATLLCIDPVPHSPGFPRRIAVFVAAVAGHAILAKAIYAHPPIGVPEFQAQTGAMLMYYGGDAVDGLLLFIMFLRWYRSSNRVPPSWDGAPLVRERSGHQKK